MNYDPELITLSRKAKIGLIIWGIVSVLLLIYPFANKDIVSDIQAYLCFVPFAFFFAIVIGVLAINHGRATAWDDSY